MSRPKRGLTHERWMWIELIGFDNALPDFGVGAFLDNAGFVPHGLSLLFATPDFVHTHEGLDRETVFPPDYCSYAGRPIGIQRRRQEWTNHQLRGLVEELRRSGTCVFFSLLNLSASVIDGNPYRSPWCASHPEVMEYTRDGEATSFVSPIKRLADGSYYEDLLVDRVTAIARDYGFDGFHAADGYSSPRLPIWMADYSDDTVGQFEALMGIALPEGIRPEPGVPSDPARVRARADYIWANLRRPWCSFYARRFGALYAKLCRAMHAMGRRVIANNAWTRDPFEAFDRYGIDYRRLARAGLDRLVMETVAAGVSIGAESGSRADPRYEFHFMLAFAKACLPDLPLLCLNGTGDATEGWDLLNHAPAVSEREIATLGQTFVQGAEGFHHASSGPVVCLADGIRGTQWQWLRENWDGAYAQRPGRALGATVLWSEAALAAEWDDYEARRVLSRQKVAAELERRGAPLQVVARAEDLGATRGCLLVPRPELLPQDELRQVLAYEHGPVVTIGRQGIALPPADVSFAEGPGEDQLACRVYRPGREVPLPALSPAAPSALPEAFPNPPNYLYDLWFRPVSGEFLAACAALLIALSDVPRVVGEAPDLRILAFETTEGQVRVLVGNEAHYYVLARIDMLREAREVRVVSHFPATPILPDGRFLDVRVPPRGAIVLDVTLTT
jgi:hypothetical protein